MKKDQLISIFFIALLIFIIYQVCAIFSPFAQAIFWSAILAFGFFPLYDKLLKKLNGRDTTAAVIMTIFILLLVIPPLVLLILNVTSQAIDLYQSSFEFIKSGELESLIERIKQIGFIQRIQEGLFKWEIIKSSTESFLLNSTEAFGNFTAAQVGTITKNIFLSAINILIMVCFVFVFLKDGRQIYKFVYDLAPMEDKTKRLVNSHINETFSAVIRGQLLTCLVQAILTGLIFWALGLPVPILFGLATFISALIPIIGASGIWFPMAVYLLIQQSYLQAGILFVAGVFGISLIDNILKPALIGERTKLPYFLLLFGILGGLNLYGLMGVFIAPVVLSLFLALAQVYREQYA